LAAECPGTQIVSVADREADIYDIFVDAQQQSGPRAEYLIRAKEDRCTPQRDPESGPAAYRKVRDEARRSKLPCTAVFDESEWKSVWRVVTKKQLPKKPPALSKFMQLLTQLGGYNNRTTEAPPGPQPLWVGLRRMTDFATAWLAFGPKQ